ncbi:MAG: hypothetical protein QM649_18930 [Silvibacterium sp.]
MTSEIRSNAKDLQGIRDGIRQEQVVLKNGVGILQQVVKTGKLPHGNLSVNFNITDLDEVSWKTAQTTGTLAYMPYSQAQELSSIYITQDELKESEHQAARDAIVSLSSIVLMKDGSEDMDPGEAKTMIGHLGVLQGQLLLVDAFAKSLSEEYSKYLAAHPES